MSGWTSEKTKCSCFITWLGCCLFLVFFSSGGWDYKTHKISSRESADHPKRPRRKKKILSRFCASLSPRNLRGALSFSNPENVNPRGWGNSSCPPTPRAADNKNPALFNPLFSGHSAEMRAPPLTASLLPWGCVGLGFFCPLPSRTSFTLDKKENKIAVSYKIAQISLMKPIFYARRWNRSVCAEPPRASAEGAPLPWSNGATSRPSAELQRKNKKKKILGAGKGKKKREKNQNKKFPLHAGRIKQL